MRKGQLADSSFRGQRRLSKIEKRQPIRLDQIPRLQVACLLERSAAGRDPYRSINLLDSRAVVHVPAAPLAPLIRPDELVRPPGNPQQGA